MIVAHTMTIVHVHVHNYTCTIQYTSHFVAAFELQTVGANPILNQCL